MTAEEARFILGAYRPNGADAGLPALGEALRLAGSDPALAAWFDRSRAFDAAVAEKLRQIAPPEGLREAILAGARASGPQRGRNWAWAAGLAAAAALAVVLFSMKGPARPEPGAAALGAFAIADLENPNHGGLGEPARALVAALERPGPRMPEPGPIDFERLRDTGCRTLSFAGREVLEVCFSRNGTLFHFYVARRSVPKAGPAQGRPWVMSGAAGAAAVWSDSRFDYAVASAEGVAAIRRLFAVAGAAGGLVF